MALLGNSSYYISIIWTLIVQDILIYITYSESFLNRHGRQNNGSPKDVYVLISGTWEYVSLYGKRDFVDVIPLRMAR